MPLLLWLLGTWLVGGCGRIGYESRGDGTTTAIDATVDTIDAAPACPSGTTEITTGSSVCIELVERGNLTWTAAKVDCEALGRRLCTDLEWFTGCTTASGIVDMIDGDYEWVADETGGVAKKRGPSTCQGMSSHEIFSDPYVYRCCVTR